MTTNPTPSARPTDAPIAGAARPGAARGNVVVVGSASDAPRALEHPAVLDAGPLRLAGIVTIEPEDGDLRTRAADVDALVRAHRAEVILVAGPLGPAMMRAVSDVAIASACQLLAVMPTERVSGHDPVIVWHGERPLVQLVDATHTATFEAAKRVADVVLAATGLFVLAPVMAVIAVAIRLETRGPALFRHRRIGRSGVPFACLKFRSMRADAEAILDADPTLYARYRAHDYRLPDTLDQRVTHIGRLVRRTSLDELPQLWNVLVGEMSLVGPRPLVEAELEHYRGSEALLLSVRPGLTGAWAVSGRHRIAYPQRAEIELQYVRARSLRRDLRIIAATLRAIIRS